METRMMICNLKKTRLLLPPRRKLSHKQNLKYLTPQLLMHLKVISIGRIRIQRKTNGLNTREQSSP